MTTPHEKPQMLVIDDEVSICEGFQRFFSRRGWGVRTVGTASQARAELARATPDVIFLDIRLPDADGLELLTELRESAPDVAVVMITAFGGLDAAVQSMRSKAFDYLPKPIDLDEALRIAQRALKSGEPGRAASEPSPSDQLGGVQLVGRSAAMQRVFKRVAVLARSDCSVLLLGETGTGKEMVARAIHEHSQRSSGPFVAVNCGAIPETLAESELFGHVRGAFSGAVEDKEGTFAAADTGTLFLDEIGELPLAAQVKLLRVLDRQVFEPVGSTRSREVDLRILAATNRNLPAEVEAGTFRADLYYRLAVVQVELPPLADRPGDVELLAEHFVRELSGEGDRRLSGEALALLIAHTWPGNVRELRNAVAHALAVCPAGAIGPEDLPPSVRSAGPQGGPASDLLRRFVQLVPKSPGRIHPDAVAMLEDELIRYALEVAGGNQSEAAQLLGLHRNTLRRKIRELDEGRGAG